MRNRFIVTYDVCDPARLRRVFRVMRGFGDHLQYSVFRCDLTSSDLVRLKTALVDELNQREDQVLFVDLGPADGRAEEAIESLGVPYVGPTAGAVIV